MGSRLSFKLSPPASYPLSCVLPPYPIRASFSKVQLRNCLLQEAPNPATLLSVPLLWAAHYLGTSASSSDHMGAPSLPSHPTGSGPTVSGAGWGLTSPLLWGALQDAGTNNASTPGRATK